MTAETFFANFSHLADAPNGVQKLRELILQLAVQGKLVPQDERDEPAAILVERIEAEKTRLVKDGVIKKPKPLSSIADDETPFGLPNPWVWTRLGNVTTYGVTDKAELNEVTDETWVLELEDVEKTTSSLLQRVSCKDRQFRSSKNKFQLGDVIYGKLRPYLNKVIVANEDGVCTTEMLPIRGYLGISPEYLRWALKTPTFIEYANSSTHGMNLPRLGTDKGRLAPFPLPPLEEQKRIVAKVDQLMALCDELEARHQKQQQGRIRLNNSALNALLTAREPGEFANHWQRICDNFDLLYDHPETITKLRAAILQLAVQGKLVPQDPNDEPASVLLERIVADRQEMITEGTLKRFKPVASLIVSELPFQAPSGWVFERMGNLFQFIDYRGKTPTKVNSGVRLITAKNVRMGYLKEEPAEFVTEKTYHEWMTRGFPQMGDLLFTTEAPMGNVCLVHTDEPFALAQRTINLHPFSEQNQHYLVFAIMSNVVQGLISDLATGMTATGIKAAKLKFVPLPLPPLEEQKRIVAKVDQLMTLCDELEAKLNQTQQHSEKLMTATVRQLLVA